MDSSHRGRSITPPIPVLLPPEVVTPLPPVPLGFLESLNVSPPLPLPLRKHGPCAANTFADSSKAVPIAAPRTKNSLIFVAKLSN